MQGRALKVAVVDLVLVLGLFFVVGDLQWREAYAASPHAATQGYVPSFVIGLLVRDFTMSGTGVSLASPPALDWVQLLVYSLFALNGWFVYRAFRPK